MCVFNVFLSGGERAEVQGRKGAPQKTALVAVFSAVEDLRSSRPQASELA